MYDGVVKTDNWMEEHFEQPWIMGKMARPEIKDEHDFYQYLVQFGMYEPSKQSFKVFETLKKEKVWERVASIYQSYRKKWRGPAVKIYLFPVNQNNRFFRQQLRGRAGLSFSDSLFLFLSDGLEEKELEALFVHEYHHATRMGKYKKEKDDYTLLDSILFEGLAEVAVLNCCGKKYTAFWTDLHNKDFLKRRTETAYKPHFHIKRNHPLHDQLLFGGRKGIPHMMGYAVGYEIAKGYIKENKITILETFSLPSEKVLEKNQFLH
ncbi:DUF2268 domain-containing protein [Lederbergia sp. NSJ-179]|uniref:DUF2268 domain-containing protein n=1 Tax=Lederbergia sp. NSJ-179 TaxID=2931402 RepID=UPI001FD2A7C4|nr:DUF2268 domain-containing putative Zn-dependent protease [Lederbergia sp. NSJ-179]MCJ7840367.1 DUF2268 domain-containing protein [Lederbergia sp. NSJ-179]